MRWLLTLLIVCAVATPAQAASDPLVVSPGRIGTLSMGTGTVRAERAGWVAPGILCPGWTAGPLALKTDRFGEVYKAFPDEVRKGRVLSMWATGHVVSTRGIRAQGLGSRARQGSSVISVREAYPGLRKLGRWVSPDTGQSFVVYSIGSRGQGYLDFFISEGRVSFVVVRSARVSWTNGPGPVCSG